MKSIKIVTKAIGFIFVAAGIAATNSAFAQGVPVYDYAAIVEALNQELNQLNQLKQQLVDYKLNLENLKKLDGTIRNEIQGNVQNQLKNNVSDFGISDLNTIPTTSSDAGVFYSQAESVLKRNVGNLPYTEGALIGEMTSAGMDAGEENGMFQTGKVDRKKYERVLDDMRQVALTRKNAENRALQANNITAEMANLDSNNTVGAIQLLAAQNALLYAQNEDAIKNQAAILKTAQEAQARELIEAQASREKEIKRLKNLQKNSNN